MSRSAHVGMDTKADHGRMSERGLHSIVDDLSDTWLEDWAGAGVNEIEAYLAKHAAFIAFLEAEEA
jgi:hypothetical protein